MRILDLKTKEPLVNVLIMLTTDELNELIDSLQSLVKHKDHVHVDDESYKRQITVGVYSMQNLQGYSPEVTKLLMDDK